MKYHLAGTNYTELLDRVGGRGGHRRGAEGAGMAGNLGKLAFSNWSEHVEYMFKVMEEERKSWPNKFLLRSEGYPRHSS